MARRRDETEGRLSEVHGEIAASDAFEALELGGADEALWSDFDLASLAENRLGDATDPRRLDEARRADWLLRATEEAPWPPSRRASLERCYWLREGGARVGTISLAVSAVGRPLARIASFYVLACHRGHGIGSRALRTVRAALASKGLGLRLDTCWTWQRAVGFYLREGLWARTWKRDLELCHWPDAPAPIIEVAAAQARLSVDVQGHRFVLEEATRDGDRLAWANVEYPDETEEFAWYAMPTLALAIALRGWPLVRSQSDWLASRASDTGPPEALAHRIVIWEAWSRKTGWLVETPRIAGLSYSTWEELEATWNRQHAELKSRANKPVEP